MKSWVYLGSKHPTASFARLPTGGFNALVPELDVLDIEISLNFWCRLLGFDVAYNRPAAKFVYLEREGAQIMRCQVNGEWLTGDLVKPFGRGVNFQIEVKNIDVIMNSLNKAYWPLFRGANESWYRVGDDQENGSKEFLV